MPGNLKANWVPVPVPVQFNGKDYKVPVPLGMVPTGTEICTQHGIVAIVAGCLAGWPGQAGSGRLGLGLLWRRQRRMVPSLTFPRPLGSHGTTAKPTRWRSASHTAAGTATPHGLMSPAWLRLLVRPFESLSRLAPTPPLAPSPAAPGHPF